MNNYTIYPKNTMPIFLWNLYTAFSGSYALEGSHAEFGFDWYDN